MVTREMFEEFVRILTRLRETATEGGSLILVEGDRDRRALSRIGLPRESIVLVHDGRSLPDLASRLAARGRPIILLTDWDGKGGTLIRHLTRLLQGSSVPVDTETRRRLARVVRGDIVSVEELSGWAERYSETFHCPLSAGPA